MAEPNVTNLSAGQAIFYVGPSGSVVPSMAGPTAPSAASIIAAGFRPGGYTESGVEVVSTPSTKEITPDEEITPAKIIVTGIKAEIKTTMLESQLENFEAAVALSKLTNTGTGTKTLGVGSGNPLKEFVLLVVGTGPGGDGNRVSAVWRVISEAAITANYTRKDVTKLAVTLRALADPTQNSTENVYKTVDFNAGS